MRAKRGGIPKIFSTSFIDMMSIALAGQIILWILSVESTPSSRADIAHNAVVEFRQFTLDHFFHMDLTDVTGSNLFSRTLDKPGSFSTNITSGSTSIHIIRDKNASKDSPWAGQVIVMLENLDGEFRIDVKLKCCTQHDNFHYVLMESISAEQSESACLLFQSFEALEKAIKYDAKKTATFVEFLTKKPPPMGSADLERLMILEAPLEDSGWDGPMGTNTISAVISKRGKVSFKPEREATKNHKDQVVGWLLTEANRK